MKRALIFLAVVQITRLSVQADAPDVPEIVAQGFAALVKDGTLAAIDAWLAGSVRETDDRYQDEAAQHMNYCFGVMGRVTGFEPVRTVVLSPSTRRIYTVAKFEKGVGWMSFDCYRPGKAWIVCRFAFDTNPSLILPPGLLGGEH